MPPLPPRLLQRARDPRGARVGLPAPAWQPQCAGWRAIAALSGLGWLERVREGKRGREAEKRGRDVDQRGREVDQRGREVDQRGREVDCPRPRGSCGAGAHEHARATAEAMRRRADENSRQSAPGQSARPGSSGRPHHSGTFWNVLERSRLSGQTGTCRLCARGCASLRRVPADSRKRGGIWSPVTRRSRPCGPRACVMRRFLRRSMRRFMRRFVRVQLVRGKGRGMSD